MIHAPRILFLVLISALTAGSGLLAAEEDEVYSCRDADGNVTLQTDPCPGPVEQRTESRPPAPERHVARAPVRVGTTASPPPLPSTSGWTVIPRSPGPPPPARRSPGNQSFPTSLAGAPRPVGPSFESPESTWRSFVAAIEAGDRAAAAACLTPAALARLGPGVESIPVEEFRSMLGRFTRIEAGGDLGPFWSIRGLRENRRPKWIFFEETEAGEWKISGI